MREYWTILVSGHCQWHTEHLLQGISVTVREIGTTKVDRHVLSCHIGAGFLNVDACRYACWAFGYVGRSFLVIHFKLWSVWNPLKCTVSHNICGSRTELVCKRRERNFTYDKVDANGNLYEVDKVKQRKGQKTTRNNIWGHCFYGLVSTVLNGLSENENKDCDFMEG